MQKLLGKISFVRINQADDDLKWDEELADHSKTHLESTYQLS